MILSQWQSISPVQIPESARDPRPAIETRICFLSEHLLRTISTYRYLYKSVKDTQWDDNRLDIPSPATAAPKCPNTGERALLISRLTDNWAFTYAWPHQAPTMAIRTPGKRRRGDTTTIAQSLTSIDIDCCASVRKESVIDSSTVLR